MVRKLLHATIDVGDTFVGDRVSAQIGGSIPFKKLSGFLHALEESGHGARVESGLVEDTQTDTIRFLFMLSREIELVLHHSGLCADDGGRRGLRVVAGGEDGHGHRGQCGERIVLLSGDHARIVMLSDVRDLMAQHRGQFGFGLCQLDQSGVDTDEAAGQGEGIDGIVIDGEEFEWLARLGTVGNQSSTQLVEVVGYLGIVQ